MRKSLAEAGTFRTPVADGISWSWYDEEKQRAPYGKTNPFPARVNLLLPPLGPRATGLVIANAVGMEFFGTALPGPLPVAVDATVWIADGINGRLAKVEAGLPDDKSTIRKVEDLQDVRRRIIQASVAYIREMESIERLVKGYEDAQTASMDEES